MLSHYITAITSTYAFGLDAYKDANRMPVAPLPEMRTQEQIIAQIEARYAELEAEAQKPAIKWPCHKCRHSTSLFCYHPLIKGFGSAVAHMDRKYPEAHLCGQERALWEPELTILQKIAHWLGIRGK